MVVEPHTHTLTFLFDAYETNSSVIELMFAWHTQIYEQPKRAASSIIAVDNAYWGYRV